MEYDAFKSEYSKLNDYQIRRPNFFNNLAHRFTQPHSQMINTKVSRPLYILSMNEKVEQKNEFQFQEELKLFKR